MASSPRPATRWAAPETGKRSAFGAKIDYPNDLWDLALTYRRVGDGFDRSLGCVRRPGIQRFNLNLVYQPRPRRRILGLPVRQMFNEFFTMLVTDLDGRWESYRVFTAPVNWRLETGDRIRVHLDFNRRQRLLVGGLRFPPRRVGGGTAGAHHPAWGVLGHTPGPLTRATLALPSLPIHALGLGSHRRAGMKRSPRTDRRLTLVLLGILVLTAPTPGAARQDPAGQAESLIKQGRDQGLQFLNSNDNQAKNNAKKSLEQAEKLLKDTPMYIATGVAVEYAKKYGRGQQRAVVLMSDGGDSCRDKQAQAAAAIGSSNIPVSTIGFDVGNNQQAQDDMGNLSRITGGRSFQASAADPREIIRAFSMAMLPSLLKGVDLKIGGGAGGTAAQGYFSKAKALVQQQDLDGALFQFQQANKLAPESPNTNFNLSLLYEAQDQLIPALNHANNYLKLAPMAVDRGDVETRIANLQEELRKNPRTQLDPASCQDMYTWAQGQREPARKSGNVARRQAIIELLIAAQKGDCDNARKLQASYREKYP